mgnify:CR=1 FL=1|jgi:hypothetical protein
MILITAQWDISVGEWVIEGIPDRLRYNSTIGRFISEVIFDKILSENLPRVFKDLKGAGWFIL